MHLNKHIFISEMSQLYNESSFDMNNNCNGIKCPSFYVRVNILPGTFCLISALNCFAFECVDMKLCIFDNGVPNDRYIP